MAIDEVEIVTEEVEDEPQDDEGGDEDEEEEEEEGPIDPKPILFEECGETPKCSPLKGTYEACNERVSSRSNTEETCAQELFDFMHCADKCVAKKLFSLLK